MACRLRRSGLYHHYNARGGPNVSNGRKTGVYHGFDDSACDTFKIPYAAIVL
mgnify:CR=1 FL=1